jgi:hypothetical protein
MTKSKNSTNAERRAFLYSATSAAALAVATAVTGSAAALGADPIFAAIDAHKAAMAAFISVVSKASELEELIPYNLRQSHIDPDETLIVATDDPRWITNTRNYQRLNDAETDAAIALVNIAPTTVAGVIALLQYANSADTDGRCWPTDLQDDDGKKTRSWHYFLIQAMAEVLPGMVSA